MAAASLGAPFQTVKGARKFRRFEGRARVRYCAGASFASRFVKRQRAIKWTDVIY